MIDFGIESVKPFGPIAYYGCVWLVEFNDWSHAIVIEDPFNGQNCVLCE